ncbi:transcription-repair coupling factor [Acidihalobacter yilgarnensis]|uniref:Transcription-repair-coupling factor n=1 Tax=Acidihalobacter yilgarnensis TaxID=2819280 RepID=A0A1D8INL9_9GAMM|nr:transcription-repair coupling factor [Acidihalobacter yilgarnensis]AOU98011.1 transcription-repair coupling factor [Acidihalobacter yilgarnensis]
MPDSPIARHLTVSGFADPLRPPTPAAKGELATMHNLQGASLAMAAAAAAAAHDGPAMLIASDTQAAWHLEQTLRFFLPQSIDVLHLEDWETLPYDVFSPHDDIVSQRLAVLNRLPGLTRGVLVVPIQTLMQRLAPQDYIRGHSLNFAVGQRLDVDTFRLDLEAGGYRAVNQVMAHGEFAVRGEILDLFPMGSPHPYRLDLFDDEIESIRDFDPENQRSGEIVEHIELMPGHEFPLNDEGIKTFRRRYRERFEGDPQSSAVYRGVSQGNPPGGIEYYLPLFFEQTATLFDYLAERTLVMLAGDVWQAAERQFALIVERHEQRRHDIERPLLEPGELYLDIERLRTAVSQYPCLALLRASRPESDGNAEQADTAPLPPLRLEARAAEPAAALRRFLHETPGRVLFTAESAGRREALADLLRGHGLRPKIVDRWDDFVEGSEPLGLCVAPLEAGVVLPGRGLVLIDEQSLFGQRAQQHRRTRRQTRDADAVIRNLTDLNPGAPVVHEEHGVGRYQGLSRLNVGDIEAEFLVLEYAGGDRLYVPVVSLHLISRYTGASPEEAPLHKLGGDQWQRLRRRAAEKASDAAAELLEINARRAARQGQSFILDGEEYAAFAGAFPFEETPDQQTAIEAVLTDLAAPHPMDRVVCGDVGFGKTEVAMRAAFAVAHNGYQVAILVPTTLLAEQHLTNFRDRFAEWPFRIESLSRFRSKKEQDTVLDALSEGTVDIVIGTHKLLGSDIHFKRLGLAIIDEEHRFGVRHKERLKQLRAEVDLLTLTATPIPRTLNMSLAGLRDLSIIATPPPRRHTIKTFVHEWSDSLISEACARELSRGGQLYFLHNEVKSIERAVTRLRGLLPNARIGVAHGQMRERDLEQVMLDFYHRRYDVLVCTTIIESGIDVPNANTIVIDRADRLGLAQLHQLRGRVGRSHHRAYAYLITPPPKAMTPDAVKRLEAVESLGELGVGFSLATHDLEIRGAGELLGEDQSGQIQEIGFSLYNELLERAVAALKAGKLPELERPLDHGAEVDLAAPALLPDDYVSDVHTRLILYKRIASAHSQDELRELQVELIDRFGLLPDAAKNLFEMTRLKLSLATLGVRKLEAGPQGLRIIFSEQTVIDPARLIALLQSDPQRYRLDGQFKLRASQPLPGVAERIDAIDALVERLGAPVTRH